MKIIVKAPISRESAHQGYASRLLAIPDAIINADLSIKVDLRLSLLVKMNLVLDHYNVTTGTCVYYCNESIDIGQYLNNESQEDFLKTLSAWGWTFKPGDMT